MQEGAGQPDSLRFLSVSDSMAQLSSVGLDMKFLLEQEFVHDVERMIVEYESNCLTKVTRVLSEDHFVPVPNVDQFGSPVSPGKGQSERVPARSAGLRAGILYTSGVLGQGPSCRTLRACWSSSDWCWTSLPRLRWWPSSR